MKRTIKKNKLKYTPREIAFDGALLMVMIMANLIVWFAPDAYQLVLAEPVTGAIKISCGLGLLFFIVVCYPYLRNSSTVELKPKSDSFSPHSTNDTFYI